MAQQEYIKFLRDEEGLSINGIANQMGLDWRTARKYADQTDWNVVKKPRKRKHPVLEPYLEIIDTWLLEDQRRPKKQRHTNIRIFERLKEECGFKGGERTVTTYVAKKKKEIKESLLPQEPFDVHRLSTTKLDKYGKVDWDGVRFSIPKGTSHELVVLKTYWDQVIVLNEQYEQISTFPRPYTFKEREIEWIAELELTQHKPKAVPYSWIYSQLPSAIQNYVDVVDLHQRKKRVGWLIKWLKAGYTVDNVNTAIQHTSVYQQDQEGILYHKLYSLTCPQVDTEALPESYTPCEVKDYDPDLHAYDQLSKGGVLDEYSLSHS